MKRVTIKDVAKALCVSVSSVSRAFNDSYDIHPETKKMILEKAKEMGYHPNPLAQRLSSSKTKIIGVVVPEFVNVFFPKVIMGIQKVMKEAGYQVLIMSSDESAVLERENVTALENYHIDGLIISLSQETRDITFLKELQAKGLSIVQFNRVSQKLDTPKVVFDDYAWAYKATEHLIEQGYKKIYHLSGPCNLIPAQTRRKAFLQALKDHHLPSEDSQVIETGIFIEDGQNIAKRLIGKKDVPDAFFCFNDPLAIGAIKAFREVGYEIPQEVAFVGFTESRFAEYITPSLTTVEQPRELIGEKAANLMLELLDAKQTSPSRTEKVGGILKIRESSVRAR